MRRVLLSLALLLLAALLAARCASADIIDAGNLSADGSGASRLELTGQGQDGDISASGASQANLGDFRMQNVSVELSGASRAEVYADPLRVHLADGSRRVLGDSHGYALARAARRSRPLRCAVGAVIRAP